MVGNHSRTRILLEHLRHVALIRLRKVPKTLCVPGDVEDADHTALVMLDGTNLVVLRHCPAEGVCTDPGVGHQVSCIAIINGVLHRCSTGHY